MVEPITAATAVISMFSSFVAIFKAIEATIAARNDDTCDCYDNLSGFLKGLDIVHKQAKSWKMEDYEQERVSSSIESILMRIEESQRWPSTQLDHAQLSLERSTYRCCEPNRKSEVPVHVFKEPSGFCDANGDVEESQEEGNTLAWK
ncbi:hypothetical protein DL95DRAFT_465404 [Leptodontidium sp. 2 PMI_412]|nr:hypothetical protein DL95DRAFT_465404 [Leptodontidium sp. 2 PMI_412]